MPSSKIVGWCYRTLIVARTIEIINGDRSVLWMAQFGGSPETVYLSSVNITEYSKD
jgi:hypothetical protein